MPDIKAAAYIQKYASEVFALIERVQELYKDIDANETEPRLNYELSLCQNVLDEIATDQSIGQREWLTDEYFLYGSNTLPGIRGQASRAITKFKKN